MTACLRCGKCCNLWIDREPTSKDCPHLVRLQSGRTLCRVYKTRLGRKTGKETQCFPREEIPVNYPGCPFNRPEWKMILIRENGGEGHGEENNSSAAGTCSPAENQTGRNEPEHIEQGGLRGTEEKH